jgi:hypothetical protein
MASSTVDISNETRHFPSLTCTSRIIINSLEIFKTLTQFHAILSDPEPVLSNTHQQTVSLRSTSCTCSNSDLQPTSIFGRNDYLD